MSRKKVNQKASHPAHSLKVGVVQMSSNDDIDHNLKQVWDLLDQLPRDCDVICFPENALFLRLSKNTKSIKPFTLKEKFWQKLSQYAKENNSNLIFGSVPIAVNDHLYNSMVIVGPKGAPKVAYRKIHLFDVDVEGSPPQRESDFFKHGPKPAILKIKGWNIGLSICYDIRFSELYHFYAKKNAHLILVPSAFLVPTGEAHWHVLMRARAIECQSYLVAAAQSGGHVNVHGDRRETYGHSLVVHPWGQILADLGASGVAAGHVVLEPSELLKVKRQIPMSYHRRLNS